MKANQDNLYAYNTGLKDYARENRNAATKAEACLWKYALRAKGMKGYGFRRQRPVLNYIADFMCKELMLIIEVDGDSHAHPKVAAADEIRQKALEAAGFTVLRFDDEDVLKHINNVRSQIESWIEAHEK